MNTRHKTGIVRIIGGKWRGRKIHFDAASVRPTKDIVRETVFNWLAPVMVDSVCLDLFAGSGALGFEALSRGAKYVLMVDQEKKVINKLKENAEILNAAGAEFLLARVPERFPRNYEKKFSLVFLDPPFNHGLISQVCTWLETSKILAPDALIYIEAEKSLAIAEVIPKSWKIERHKISGDVQYSVVILN